MPKKGGKKGKGGKVEMLTDKASLAAYGVEVRDIVQTPLGVEATVVGLNKKDGLLYLAWPGGGNPCPVPADAKDKAGMEAYGYRRKQNWAHIQRSIDERVEKYFQQRWYGAPAPKTAAIKLPWPEQPTWATPVGIPQRPGTAPA